MWKIAGNLVVCSLAFGIVPNAVRAEPAPSEAALEFFEKKVRPVLVNNCYNCHSANTKALGGLRVDDRNGLLTGGSRGAAIVPGAPEKSLLIKAVRHEGKPKMPPEKQISEQEVADLERWIREGAAWPAATLPYNVGQYAAKYEKLRKEHWAFQPVQRPHTPDVKDAAWAKDPIDRFILSALEAKKLKPVADADKVTLIRRATFDLTGLPPTIEEIDAFLADNSPNAFAKVVDRLLASPAFGERWGRHWLDVARYGESTGPSRNIPLPHAWRYRDYVIDAFNADRPYDQFVREQIAGDLLPAKDQAERDRLLIATGFLALGVKDVNQRFKVRFVMDNIDEQIDTVSRSLLGLTASCARCHDHKFDPIPTDDYYALAGIFNSTDLCAGLRNKMGGGGLAYYDTSMIVTLGGATQPKADPELAAKIEKLTEAVEDARRDFQKIQGTSQGKAKGADGRPVQMVARQKMLKLQAELIALTDPALSAPVAHGVREAKTIGDTEIRIRGEAEKLGPKQPRGFLSAVKVPDAPAIPSDQSGRLELAQWLTSKDNPLASRVIVNRVWKHLFGQGIVRSVDNFGVTGDAPSHPQLLDHLATRFLDDGWSIKRLVRTLVLTRSYQLGYEAPASHLEADPANRLVWRHSPRRLDAEEIRDATLSAAATLKLERPDASPAKDLKVVELPNNGPIAQRLLQEAAKSTHRSIYLPLLRGVTPRSLEVFDFAEQTMVTGSRDSTTVAPQALYLLNDPFVQQQSVALAERLLKPKDANDTARIRLAYRLALGREADPREIERAGEFLKEAEADLRAEARNPKASVEPVEDTPRPKKKDAAAEVNPDDIDRTPEVARDDSPFAAIEARTAAWATFAQAILASAEFRYVR